MVDRARDTELNRFVALKRLRTSTKLEEAPTDTLFKEAITLASLQRDLQPSNIIVMELPGGSLHVKLLDFGITQYALRPCPQTVDADGCFKGIIHTISPEQLRQEPIDLRSDLYALGCVFYFMPTGRMPFSGETVAETLQNHLAYQVLHLAQVHPDLPHSLTVPIMSLMAHESIDRRASAGAALRELTKLTLEKNLFLMALASLCACAKCSACYPQSRQLS